MLTNISDSGPLLLSKVCADSAPGLVCGGRAMIVEVAVPPTLTGGWSAAWLPVVCGGGAPGLNVAQSKPLGIALEWPWSSPPALPWSGPVGRRRDARNRGAGDPKVHRNLWNRIGLLARKSTNKNRLGAEAGVRKNKSDTQDVWGLGRGHKISRAELRGPRPRS